MKRKKNIARRKDGRIRKIVLQKTIKNRHTKVSDEVIKLARFMWYKIDRLASRGRHKSYATRDLILVVRLRKNLGYSCGKGCSRKTTYRMAVPLILEEKEAPLIDFWHQLTRRMALYRVRLVCEQNMDMLVRAKSVALEARDLVRHHPKRWDVGDDDGWLEDVTITLRKIGRPYEGIMHADEVQKRVLRGLDPFLNSEGHEMFDNQREKKLKQTKISDFFKPIKQIQSEQ